MINDFEEYKRNKKLINYNIYLNCKLISNYIFLDYDEYGRTYDKYNIWYCKNYEIYKKKLLNNYIKDNEFFFNKNLASKDILDLDYHHFRNVDNHYCHFYVNEKNEGILIYFSKNILYYRNIETFDDFKKIKITDDIENELKSIAYINCLFLINNNNSYLLIDNTLGSFVVFRIYNAQSEKIFSIIKKGDGQNYYDDTFIANKINYFNKNIYVSSFYINKILIYNILLYQLEFIMNFNDEIKFTYNDYFLNNKNINDFLFVTTDKQCNIYELKTFKLKKILPLKNIYRVLLSEINNRICFIISYDNKLSIIDFITNDIIFMTYSGRTECLFLWNQNTIIRNYPICSCADTEIIDLFDGKQESVFDVQNDFWWTSEIFKLNLKKYGECLLRIGLNKINIYYIKSEEEIKKEKEEKDKLMKEEWDKLSKERNKNIKIEKFNVDEYENYIGNLFD